MKKLNNDRGAVLIISIMVLYILITVAVAVSLSNVGELNAARRYNSSTRAFWLAEAGINMFMKDTTMLDQVNPLSIGYGGGNITLTRDDSQLVERRITSTGTADHIERQVRIAYPVNMPEVYKNMISTQKDINITGKKNALIINDKVRVSGKLNDSSKYSSALFEDLRQGQDPLFTTLQYAGDANEGFNNFISHNQKIVTKYPESEVLYIKADGTYTVDAEKIKGKKVLYVEGNLGTGNVVINGSIVGKDQNLTIIATGTVTFNQNGDQAANSQLNIMSWGGYNETVSGPSSHKGLIFTHGMATFSDIKDSSTTTGGLIADGGITFNEVWSTKTFNYADLRINGEYPAGFEGLAGGSITGIAGKPTSWKEVSSNE